jgi:hypothetical protein
MRIKSALLVLAAIVSAAALGCKEERQPQSGAATIRDFTLNIEGTAGLEVDMLLITKPSSGSIERETATVTVPFSKSFRSVKCVVWIDHEFRGKAGEYRVVLKEDGKPSGELEGRIEEGHKGSGRLGML